MIENRILFVAYQLPPCGGAGVQRAVQLCGAFPEEGILPVLLTTDEKTYKKENRKTDLSLSSFLTYDMPIYKIANPFPYGLRSFLLRVRAYFLVWYFLYPLFWEAEFLWAIKACFRLKGIFRSERIEIVLTTSGPFSSILIGYVAKRFFKKKWICDLRDPFTDAYAWNFPSLIHRNLIRILELKGIKEADKIVVTSDATRKRYIEIGISPEKISVITNGYS